MRDNHGRFVKGHKLINKQDPKTGKFTSVDDIHREIDRMLGRNRGK